MLPQLWSRKRAPSALGWKSSAQTVHTVEIALMTIEQTHHIRVQVVRHPGNGRTGTLLAPKQAVERAAPVNAGLMVLPMRWVASS